MKYIKTRITLDEFTLHIFVILKTIHSMQSYKW